MKTITKILLIIIGILILAAGINNLVWIIIYQKQKQIVQKEKQNYKDLENIYKDLLDEKNLLSQDVKKYIEENQNKEKIIIKKNNQLIKIQQIKNNKELTDNEKIKHYRDIINNSN